MANFPQSSFDAMRQDAIRRSREMHRRAVPPPPPEMPPPPPPPEPEHHEPPPHHPPEPEHHPPELPPPPEQMPPELFSLFTKWDTDKILVGAILYILWKEKADTALLLALAYILL